MGNLDRNNAVHVNLFYYESLSPTAKLRAIGGVQAMHQFFYDKAKADIIAARKKRNIHQAINYGFSSCELQIMARKIKALKEEVTRSEAEWAKIITENLMQFSIQGHAYSYTFKRFF